MGRRACLCPRETPDPRREFLQATAAAAALTAGSGIGPLDMSPAPQKRLAGRHFALDPLGPVTILHTQTSKPTLMPDYFRYPRSISGATPRAARTPPSMRPSESFFKIATAPPMPRTDLRRFRALARTMAAWAHRPHRHTGQRGAHRRGADKCCSLDAATLAGKLEPLAKQAQDMIEVKSALKLDAMTAHWSSPPRRARQAGGGQRPVSVPWRRTSATRNGASRRRGAQDVRKSASRLLSLVRRCRAERGRQSALDVSDWEFAPRGGHPEAGRGSAH